jgi:PAS domain S-box-containing protein
MLSQHRIRRQDEVKALNRYEFRFVTKSGDIRGIYLTVAVIQGTKQSVASLLDITERKHAETALQESKRQLDAMANNIPGVVYRFSVNSDGTYGLDYISERSRQILGLENDPATFFDQVTKGIVVKDRERFLRSVQDAIKTKTLWEFESQYVKPSGKTIWISAVSSPLMEHDHLIFDGVIFDNTDRKRTEETLMESEERFRQFFKTTLDCVFITSPDDRWIDCNDALVEIFGYESHNEVFAIPVSSFYAYPEERAAFLELVSRDGYVKEHPMQFRKRDGTVFDSLITIVAQKNPDGSLKAFIGTIHDVTERKRADERIRWLASFPEMNPNPVIEMDAQGTITYANIATLTTLKNLGLADNPAVFVPEDKDEILHILHHGTEPQIYREITLNNQTFAENIALNHELHVLRIYTRNITDHKRDEEALIRNSEELQASYEQLTATEEELRASLDELTRNERIIRQSEELFRGLFDTITSGVGIYEVRNDGASGKDYIIKDFNKVALEIEGRRKEDVIGKNLLDLRPAIDEYGLIPVFMQVWITGVPAFFPQKIYADEKYSSWYENRVFRLQSGEIVAVYDDITERKRTEEALVESEANYRILLDESSDPIFSFYPDGTYRYVNRAFAEGVGKSVDRIIGKKIWDVFQPEEAEKRFSALRMVFSTGEGKEIEVRVPRSDGDRYYVTTIVPVKDDTGSVVSALCVSKDITERKRIDAALRAANRKLTLLSGITRHDINNQLTVLQGYQNILGNNNPDLMDNEYFQKVAIAAQRISAMIRFTGEYESIGVNAPVWQDCRKLIDTVAKQAPLGKVTVKNDLPAGAEVFADPLIARVFYNLMENAVRYGGKITTIRFSLLESDGDMVVLCEDDGYGVCTEEKENVFERGFGKNTGLGLALSREILDITGITIKESGEPGSGARFEIAVPAGAYRVTEEKKTLQDYKQV